MGSKYIWKPDRNPPPGLYDIDKAASMTKPKMKTARIGTSQRSDFTKTAMQENPSAGNYETIAKFGSNNKSKMTIGGKYKWKPDSNPPPGLYEPNVNAVKPKSKMLNMSPNKTKRTDFTDTPMKEMPDAGLYDGHIKAFGSENKSKMTIGGKYKWKPDSNPPPGLYEPDKAMSATLPKNRSTVIR